MEKRQTKGKRWSMTIVVMLCMAFFSQFILDFDAKLVWIVTSIFLVAFIPLGEKIYKYEEDKEGSRLHLVWGISMILIAAVISYAIESGNMVVEEGYFKWLKKITEEGNRSLEYEGATLVLGQYIVFLFLYGSSVWKVARYKINDWLPNFEGLIGAVGIVFYIKEEGEGESRLNIIIATAVLLIGYRVIRYLNNREKRIRYELSPIQYLKIYVMNFILVISVGLIVPEYHELPGARWIRNAISQLSGNTSLQRKVPLQKGLNDDIKLSEAILFRVKASESLYLRDMAYKDYENGIWSVVDDKVTEDSITFKPQYLQAEYLQTESMLDELSYQNSQNKSIFPRYAAIANHEASVVRKRQYTVLQNPINKINYFTVNGITNIKDEANSAIYYYQNINNCYFYNGQLIEPSNYTVEYYEHTPRMGSREYMFLQEMNASNWETLYSEITNNRQIYGYGLKDYPKLLLTYTPMIQYHNATKNFLQLPKELKGPIRKLTRRITVSKRSDWSRAESICIYLKEKYSYSLYNKSSGEKEPIYNFLFKDKEGICQEFATSMVLMCRSIGIPAKYVTGYLVTEKENNTGDYIVREKDAHAFVEVYIAGYGWMTFDPTPSIGIEEEKRVQDEGWSMKESFKIVGVITFLIILFIISRGGTFYLQDLIWQIRVKFYKPDKQIEMVMLETCKWLETQGYKREKYETLSNYCERLNHEGIQIHQMKKLYEAHKYGGLPINKKDAHEAYREYKALKTKLKNN